MKNAHPASSPCVVGKQFGGRRFVVQAVKIRPGTALVCV